MLTPKDWLLILSAVGFAVSFYSWYVDLNLRRHAKYKPFCDFNKKMSCSRNFASSYGHIAGVSNALIGVLFYAVVFALASFEIFAVVNVLSFLAVGISLLLAYFSYFKLRNFCIVCTSVYIANIILLFVSYRAIG